VNLMGGQKVYVPEFLIGNFRSFLILRI